jgi:hypothetical protein
VVLQRIRERDIGKVRGESRMPDAEGIGKVGDRRTMRSGDAKGGAACLIGA